MANPGSRGRYAPCMTTRATANGQSGQRQVQEPNPTPFSRPRAPAEPSLVTFTRFHRELLLVPRLRQVQVTVEQGGEAAAGDADVDGDDAVVGLADAAEVLPLYAGRL